MVEAEAAAYSDIRDQCFLTCVYSHMKQLSSPDNKMTHL